jgi:hypothetical protein
MKRALEAERRVLLPILERMARAAAPLTQAVQIGPPAHAERRLSVPLV